MRRPTKRDRLMAATLVELRPGLPWSRADRERARRRRSEVMRAIKSKDTKPELFVRDALRGLGMRRHVASLPGTPDFACTRRRAVVFVHGCFWHRHSCVSGSPRTNADQWRAKFERNVSRDRRNARELRALGYRVMALWECGLRDKARVRAKVERFLNQKRRTR